jgi:hypothetical protein
MRYLNKQTTYAEILSWKLHWLYCDLSHSKEKENLSQKENSINDAIQLLHRSKQNFNRLLWDIKTIVDADSEQDILAELKGTEKYIKYENEYNSIVGKILKLYRKNQDSHFKVLVETLTNLL